MTPSEIDTRLGPLGLVVAGLAPILPEDGLHPALRTVVLLAPDEPAFWNILTASPEWQDGAPDPVDRWSRRVIGRLACDLGLKAAFPFGGPPWHPFVGWALRSGRCHSSPVGLLVHDMAGLWISFRGALLLRESYPAAPSPRPCDTCAARPCETACPAGALTPAGYDVPVCHAWLDGLSSSFLPKYPGGEAPQEPGGPRPPDPVDCRTGCLVRRACPVGQSRRRPEQSAHHMRHFHP